MVQLGLVLVGEVPVGGAQHAERRNRRTLDGYGSRRGVFSPELIGKTQD
jgi:hypothetical protein